MLYAFPFMAQKSRRDAEHRDLSLPVDIGTRVNGGEDADNSAIADLERDLQIRPHAEQLEVLRIELERRQRILAAVRGVLTTCVSVQGQEIALGDPVDAGTLDLDNSTTLLVGLETAQDYEAGGHIGYRAKDRLDGIGEIPKTRMPEADQSLGLSAFHVVSIGSRSTDPEGWADLG